MKNIFAKNPRFRAYVLSNLFRRPNEQNQPRLWKPQYRHLLQHFTLFPLKTDADAAKFLHDPDSRGGLVINPLQQDALRLLFCDHYIGQEFEFNYLLEAVEKMSLHSLLYTIKLYNLMCESSDSKELKIKTPANPAERQHIVVMIISNLPSSFFLKHELGLDELPRPAPFVPPAPVPLTDEDGGFCIVCGSAGPGDIVRNPKCKHAGYLHSECSQKLLRSSGRITCPHPICGYKYKVNELIPVQRNMPANPNPDVIEPLVFLID